jgi:hypothetical protein
VEAYDGAVLTLTFPEDQDFYVGMAKDRKHVDVLGDVLEERIGSRPRLEVRTGEAPEPGAQEAEAVPPERPVSRDPAPPPPPLQEEPPAPVDEGGFDEPVARVEAPGARFGSPEAGDGTIRSEAEVFEIMRGFDAFGQGIGN